MCMYSCSDPTGLLEMTSLLGCDSDYDNGGTGKASRAKIDISEQGI